MRTEPKRSCIVATGLVALDIIFGASSQEASAYAGGTCGNVLSILAYLGWKACPFARLAQDQAAAELLADLERLSVDTSFVSTTTYGTTPIIIQYLRTAADGSRTHSFSMRCPECRKHLPSYRPAPLKLLEEVEGELPVPDVFFFDRVSPSALRLAERSRTQGGVVVFEPSGVSDATQFSKALELAHVIKYSTDRFPDGEVFSTNSLGALLLVETLGCKGLRIRTSLAGQSAEDWHEFPPFPVKTVRDAAGAGDWCTAGILHKLAAGGAQHLSSVTWEQICEAMTYGQALASWTCHFEGARGGMYQTERSSFENYVATVLTGNVEFEPAGQIPPIVWEAQPVKICSCTAVSGLSGKHTRLRACTLEARQDRVGLP